MMFAHQHKVAAYIIILCQTSSCSSMPVVILQQQSVQSAETQQKQ
jgi:hypothetical protein